MTEVFLQKMSELSKASEQDINVLIPLTAVYIEAVADRMDLYKFYEEKIIDACSYWGPTEPLAVGLMNLVKSQGSYYDANFEKSMLEARQAISIFEEKKLRDLFGTAQMLLGGSLRSLGELDDSVNHLLIASESIDPKGIFAIYNGYAHYQLAEIYASIKDYEAAEHSYLQVTGNESISSQVTPLFRSLNGLGNLFLAKKDYPKALEYLNKAMEVANIGTHKSRGLCDLGNYYLELNELDKAEKHFHESYLIRKENKAEDAASTSLIGLSKSNIRLGNYDKAIEQINEALDITYRFNAKNKTLQCYKILAEINELLGNWKEAYTFQLNYDKLFDEITSLQLQNIYKLKNNKIEVQKTQIELAHREIKDSINYAKRIQEAIMPSIDDMYKALGDSFILYMPKDIVAGDFYWMEKSEDNVYFAAADCTGHGVPGAMVSMVCSNALTKSLHEEGIENTAKLLDKTRELVISRLARSGEEVKDGMDISICKWNKSSNQLQWSGANNSIWIYESSSKDIKEIKPNKQPIGISPDPKPFDSHNIELQKGDIIYIFTDGYQDQFGGPKGKKFKAAQLKKLLVDNYQLTMSEQQQLLHNTISNWRGDIEQIDDICIIGVKI